MKGYTRITSPMKGEVAAIVTQQGQTVIAQQQAPVIVKLADLDTMTVKAQVSETDIVRVRPEQEVYFTILGDPERRYYGKLRTIEPAPRAFLETQNDASGSGASHSDTAVYYSAMFDVPNADHHLRIAMTALTHILINSAHHVLTIPVAALNGTRTDGTDSVLVVDSDGTPHMRSIQTGIRDDLKAEVLSGLREGEEVIVGEPEDQPDNPPTSNSIE